MNLTEIKKCLACDSDNLLPVLDLNNQPLANSYKKSKDEYEDYFPLKINRCTTCFHVQLTHAVNPDLIYKNYLYVSGTIFTYELHTIIESSSIIFNLEGNFRNVTILRIFYFVKFALCYLCNTRKKAARDGFNSGVERAHIVVIELTCK